MTKRTVLSAEAIDVVLSALPQREKRLQLGRILRELFDADVFVSYRRDASGHYADPVQINMGAGRLEQYQSYYRHVDRLTPSLMKPGRATAVAVSTRARDEFLADFLRPQDMRYGVNFFPSGHGADFRLWRGRRRNAFSDDEVGAFRAFGELFARMSPHMSGSAGDLLTDREQQVAQLVAEGLSDKQIAQRLAVALPTLRTHLRHIFAKTGAGSRVELARRVLLHHQE